MTPIRDRSSRVIGVEIRSVAEAPELVAGVGELFREYEQSLGVDLRFQRFDAELAGLPGAYAPPSGCLLVAIAADQPVACVGLRRLDAHTAELKRLYVRPRWRGRGLGRELVTRVLDVARELQYRRIVLDTLPSMHEAQRLYELFGFVDARAYYKNPLPGVRFMQLDLDVNARRGRSSLASPKAARAGSAGEPDHGGGR